MPQTLRCPGCDAELTLPSLPSGQTVQCPRCQFAFESSAIDAVSGGGETGDSDTPEERADLHDPLDASDHSMTSDWSPDSQPILALLILAVVSCCLQAYLASMPVMFAVERDVDRPLAVFDWFRRNLYPDLLTLVHWEFPAILVHWLLFVGTFLSLLVWVHQATYSSIRRLQIEGMAFTPGMAVGFFLIPVLNLVGPYAVIQDLWRASHPEVAASARAWKGTPRSVFVCVWWPCFLAGLALSYYGRGDTWSLSGTVSTAAGQICFLIAGILLIGIVRAINRRQRQLYIRLYEYPD